MTQTVETQYAPNQHTPGPWTLDPTKSFYVFDGKDIVCNANRLANARLIAAAPDLLAAIQYVTDMLSSSVYPDDFGQFRECVINARAAIAKAKGE